MGCSAALCPWLRGNIFVCDALQAAQASGGRQSIFLLDEVDAALDEQNQYMVAKLLQVRRIAIGLNHKPPALPL